MNYVVKQSLRFVACSTRCYNHRSTTRDSRNAGTVHAVFLRGKGPRISVCALFLAISWQSSSVHSYKRHGCWRQSRGFRGTKWIFRYCVGWEEHNREEFASNSVFVLAPLYSCVVGDCGGLTSDVSTGFRVPNSRQILGNLRASLLGAFDLQRARYPLFRAKVLQSSPAGI